MPSGHFLECCPGVHEGLAWLGWGGMGWWLICDCGGSGGLSGYFFVLVGETGCLCAILSKGDCSVG